MPHFLIGLFAALGAWWFAVRREFAAASPTAAWAADPAPLSKPDSGPPVKPIPTAGATGAWTWTVRASGGATGRWEAPAKATPYLELFNRATAAYALPAGLLARVAQKESNYNPNAINRRSGAAGLMQWMPWIASKVGFDPFDPAAAIDRAGAEFKQLFRRFGDWRLALAAYNFGQGNLAEVLAHPTAAIAAWGPNGVPDETADYVQTIAGDLGL
jgi:peptidoglycan DL-endopeptidase CwlO